MSYPFVPAAVQLGRRRGPVKAFLVHMAEGGGTVGFLSRPNPRSVSVHYVIERTGRIVQMVRESDATGSVNPTDIRLTDDSDGFYGVTVAKRVMGEWHRDPNSAVISLEIEGFAATGPNAAQHASLRVLIEDVRTRFPSMGLLGHRDFTSRKACPGKLIHWQELGGHGSAQPDITGEGADDMVIPELPDDFKAGTFTVNGAGHSYFRLADGTLRAVPDGFTKRVVGPVILPTGTLLGDTLDRRTGYLAGRDMAVFLGVDGTFTPDKVETAHTITVQYDGQTKAEVQV